MLRDEAMVIERGLTVTVPYGTFQNCIKIKETTVLEPDVIGYKYYAPGIGQVSEEEGSSLSKLLKFNNSLKRLCVSDIVLCLFQNFIPAGCNSLRLDKQIHQELSPRLCLSIRIINTKTEKETENHREKEQNSYRRLPLLSALPITRACGADLNAIAVYSAELCVCSFTKITT
jgi:hypothetical protein